MAISEIPIPWISSARRHHPAGRVEAECVAHPKSCECRRQDGQNLLGSGAVDLSQRGADRPEPRDICHQIAFGDLARNICPSRLRSTTSRSLRGSALTLALSAKANCPGAFGSGAGAGGRKGAAARAAAVMKSFSAGLRQATKASLRARLRGLPDVGECRHGIVEEHDAEARDDSVEATCLKRIGLRIGCNEFGVRNSFRLRACRRKGYQRLGNVEPDTASRIADAARHRQGRGSGSRSRHPGRCRPRLDSRHRPKAARTAPAPRQGSVADRPRLCRSRRSRARLAEYSASQIASWRTSLSCCSDPSLRALYEFKST